MKSINIIIMKNIKYIIVTALLLLSVTGCEVLDKEPLDVVSDAIVWNDATLVETYLANLYFETDFIELRHQRYAVRLSMIPTLGGESRSYGIFIKRVGFWSCYI